MSSKVKIKKPPDIVENNKKEEEKTNEQVYRTIKCLPDKLLSNLSELQKIKIIQF